MIIDAHVHISATDYGNADKYLEQMRLSSIDQGVIVPGGMLDVRKMTDYITGKAKPQDPVPNNNIISESFNKHTNTLHGLACVDPHRSDSAETLADYFKQGFRGLKLSPLSHQFSFASRTVAALAACCGEHGFPVYTHVVYSPGASTARYIQLARQFPQTNFIIGHMGFGPADQEALQAAIDLDNFFLETSQGSFLHIKEAVHRAGPEKIIFGSEYPLSHPMVELQKILLLNLPGSAQDKILGDNIKALLKLA
ncbi:MAG: amidohydrolase family protein [Syntrophomonadaceae bacterium]